MAYTNRNRKAKSVLATNVLVSAGPGCGKTSTMIGGLNWLLQDKKPSWTVTPEQEKIWEVLRGDGEKPKKVGFMAFNKSIATEIQEKVPQGVDARTFHSFGFALLREHGFRLSMSDSNCSFRCRDAMGYKKDERASDEDYRIIQNVCAIIGWLKNNLLEPTSVNVKATIAECGVEVEPERFDRVVELCKSVMDTMRSIEPGKNQWIDFDDMIWLPVVLDLEPATPYDLLICDETQDLNPVQHKLITRAAKRIIAIGDPRQAIYGFRGASSDSMGIIESILSKRSNGCCVLPLMTSFRLPKTGVSNVNGYAPDLKPASNAVDGTIERIMVNDMRESLLPGDLVLSRINGNIFIEAFKMLKQKKHPVQIQGRDFGSQLVSILKKNCAHGGDQKQLLDGLSIYSEKETARINKKMFPDRLLDAHNEKMDCLMSLISNCTGVDDAINVIESLFTVKDREKVILFSTIHRAKGLEAERVFILEPELIPHPMAQKPEELKQEFNLRFVAETRHKKYLAYVHKPAEDEQDD